MKRTIFEIPVFLGLASGIHLALWPVAGDMGMQSSGAGGTAAVSLMASSASIEHLVTAWETPPGPQTELSALAPPSTVALAQPERPAPSDPVRTPSASPPHSSPAPAPDAPAEVNRISEQAPAPTVVSIAGLVSPVDEAPVRAPLPSMAPAPSHELPEAIPAPPQPQLDAPPTPETDPGAQPANLLAPQASPRPPARPAPARRPDPTVSQTAPAQQPAQPSQSAEDRPAQTASGTGGGTAAGQGEAGDTSIGQGHAQQLLARWGGQIRAAIERRKRYPRGVTASGTARLSLSVSTGGSLVSVSLTGSSGHPALDAAALAAVQNARLPRARQGVPDGTYSFQISLSFSR